MAHEIDDFPKDERGKRLQVFGSMQFEAYVSRLRKRVAGVQVNVLPVSPAAQEELSALRRQFPDARLELHPRITSGIVDLIPTAYVPQLREPSFNTINLQQEGRDRRAAQRAGDR